jgi:hypothetical protein
MAHRIGLIIILVLVSFYAPAGAEICVTKDGGPQTPHDGTCGKKAFSALELQQAIYAAYYANKASFAQALSPYSPVSASRE